MDPKHCGCGARASQLDARVTGEAYRRRYVCPVCGARWSTIEHRVEEVVHGSKVDAYYSMEEAERSRLREAFKPHLEAIQALLSPQPINSSR